jgi:dolichol-phosphate mannosyltransferase
MKALVIIATYNERDNVEPLSAEILASPIGADLLVIDDNSPDGTGEVADRLAARDPRVRVIHRAGKLGLGSASLAGLKYATGHGYDYAVVMDADFSHHPRHLVELVAAMDRFDVSIGSRYVAGGGVVNWPLSRKVMSRCINLYARCLLGIRSHDCSGSYRCYRVAKMPADLPERMISTGYSYLEEILFRCQRAGMVLGEVPITFEERREGQSKISYKEAAGALWVIFRLFLERVARALGRKTAM